MFRWIALLALFATAPESYADDRHRSLNAEQLGAKITRDPAVKVIGAEVAYVDTIALSRDFPEIAKAMERGKIDSWERWILDNFAVVSKQQTRETKFNTGISHREKGEVYILRGPQDGRSGYLEVNHQGKSLGMIGVKGVGLSPSRNPAYDLDGLLSVATGISEVGRQKYIQKSADIYNAKHGTDYQTGELYFLIKYPFSAKDGRALVLLGRQALTRADGEMAELPPGLGLDPGRAVQASHSGAITDFGTVRMEDRLAKPFERAEEDSSNDVPYRDAVKAARALAAGEKDAVTKHIETLLSPLAADWKKALPANDTTSRELAEYRSEHPNRSSLESMLSVYLHSPNAGTASQLAFSLALLYQKNPAVLETSLATLKREMTTASTARSQVVERGTRLLAKTLFDTSLYRHTAIYHFDHHRIPEFPPALLKKVADVLGSDLAVGKATADAFGEQCRALALSKDREREGAFDLVEFLRRSSLLFEHLDPRTSGVHRSEAHETTAKHLENLLDRYSKGEGWYGFSSEISRLLAVEIVRLGSRHTMAVELVASILAERPRGEVLAALNALRGLESHIPISDAVLARFAKDSEVTRLLEAERKAQASLCPSSLSRVN